MLTKWYKIVLCVKKALLLNQVNNFLLLKEVQVKMVNDTLNL